MNNRLTNDMRGKIVHAAIQHRFADNISALADKFALLALEVYNEAFKKDLKRMYELPDGWLDECRGINVQLGSSVVNLPFNGEFASNYYNSKTRDIYNLKKHREHVYKRYLKIKIDKIMNVYDATHEFSLSYDALKNEAENLNVLVAKTCADLTSIIGTFKSVDKLIKEWPEIEPFTKGLIAAPKLQLLALPLTELNKALALPIVKVE